MESLYDLGARGTLFVDRSLRWWPSRSFVRQPLTITRFHRMRQLDNLARFIWGPGPSPLAQLAKIASFLVAAPKFKPGMPKQFANGCGLSMAIIATVFLFVTGFDPERIIASCFMGVYAALAALEFGIDFCMVGQMPAVHMLTRSDTCSHPFTPIHTCSHPFRAATFSAGWSSLAYFPRRYTRFASQLFQKRTTRTVRRQRSSPTSRSLSGSGFSSPALPCPMRYDCSRNLKSLSPNYSTARPLTHRLSHLFENHQDVQYKTKSNDHDSQSFDMIKYTKASHFAMVLGLLGTLYDASFRIISHRLHVPHQKACARPRDQLSRSQQRVQTGTYRFPSYSQHSWRRCVIFKESLFGTVSSTNHSLIHTCPHTCRQY